MWWHVMYHVILDILRVRHVFDAPTAKEDPGKVFLSSFSPFAERLLNAWLNCNSASAFARYFTMVLPKLPKIGNWRGRAGKRKGRDVGCAVRARAFLISATTCLL
ncbi:hypothetical protein BC832DRAFT_558955 [Gaertneriomyces semiglobifer]|nr:hypothetical protein BC832DRAFT_558955 [Gaertneriomyces semiglobifer]